MAGTKYNSTPTTHRTVLFWLMVVVHIHFKTETGGRGIQQRKGARVIVARKQRKKGEIQAGDAPFQVMISVVHFRQAPLPNSTFSCHFIQSFDGLRPP